ncbi:MAG TPA: DsbA family protein [Solirubrobacteraceae bacterium]|nr:DsbA family protein [Solirubrobacteraceae bacterium]
MRPVFRFDTNSPYAYLAAMRVNEILGPDIEWRPIAFAFVLRARNRRPWSFDESTRREGIAECEARAAARGLPALRWPPGFPVESYSLEPLRAIAAAIAHEREQVLTRALFERNFVTGEGLRTTGAVRDCWVEVGLDSASYDAEIAAAKPILAAETNRAIAEGVYGVPTVTVGDTHFWGDDQLEAAAPAAENT